MPEHASTGERTGRPLEIACDESGSDGENLTSGNTDVFAHAGVWMPTATAAGHLLEIRDRIRSPAEEYKANHLLREKHRPVLEWLLDPAGPLAGHARVQLIEKAFFAVTRVVELLAGGDGQDTGDIARTLYREGRIAYGPTRWRAFLIACNDLMRGRNRWDPTTPVDSFFHMLDLLPTAGAPGQLGEIADLLRRARPRAEAYRERIFHVPEPSPVLDPLIPAIVRTVAHWSAGGRPVFLIHDRQNTLTEERLATLGETLGTAYGLTGLRLVAARSDPRVQLADFLAGVARKIASDELNSRGDARLTALLRPFADTGPHWGDERSEALLTSGAPDGPDGAPPTLAGDPRRARGGAGAGGVSSSSG
ncbi:hypothetical protein [Streptomyces litchfieldiae]|uniref:DUF3800 domain-containing protein n=1 Tax=Streptomyces litchfieldiae TaxID=3075543 RepID=A0ABU2MZQ2_9ACTN|nr:hypothetical protein [Streptomyces sp. DSM 44938]MDT0345999.1 hypothetical protein [Streptomyces sp. DSM 44938]